MPTVERARSSAGATGAGPNVAFPDAEIPAPRFSPDHMDRSVDPACDFYRYATGTWLQKHPVPADKSRWGAFDELVERNLDLVRRILERAERLPNAEPGSVERLVGDLYASAMDVSRRDALRFQPIAAPLAEIEASASRQDILRTIAALHRRGIDAAFETYGYPDKRNSTVYAFYIEQGGLSLPDREYYLDARFEDVRKAYHVHLERTFRALGESEVEAARSAGTVFDLEHALAEASRTRTELRDEDKNYHRLTIKELLDSHPGVAWREYLRDRALPDVPYVVVGQPDFLRAVALLLLGRPLRDWKTYLRWHVVSDAAPYLHTQAEDENFDFFTRTLRGQPEPEPRWKRAAGTVDGAIGEALGQLYVRENFPPNARDRMAELVDDLREVFRERLASREWMSPATRELGLAKFARFTAKIGHPEKFRDYRSVRIERADYLGNIYRARAFEVDRRIRRVGGPVDRTEWEMTPPTVNAYFSPVKNEIVFPAGILQPPFFDLGMDDAVNYGVIGAVIGHEITHGYDDQGRKYDADGNLNDWWTPADAKEFTERARSVTEQFNAYEALPGEHVNGELTLGENLADLGGLRIAYEALERRLSKDPARRRTIDGLTPEQRFFIAWAQGWRQNCREAETKRRLAIDPHSPGEFRAVGAAANMDEFVTAFGLANDAPVVRPKDRRVTVW
jgi:putative endopeptidase